MAESLARVFDRYRYDKTIGQKSKTWFTQQVTLLAQKKIQTTTLFKQEKLTTRIVPGSLYLFQYDAKYKDSLPYFDRFPLVFPFRKMPEGFIGLNMHYLPYFWRVKLLDRLLQFADNKSLTEKTKLRYSWATINSLSTFKIAEVCVKHYLTENVKSAFIKINPTDWHTAMMLPVEQFSGSNKNLIWEQNKKWLR